MNLAIQKGRMQVIAIVVAVVATSLIGTAIINALTPNRPASETVQDGIGLVLMIVLCYFLYQKHRWAKWVMGVLLALSGLIIIPFALSAVRYSLIGSAWLLIRATICLVVSRILLRSPEIKAFLSSQRAEQWR